MVSVRRLRELIRTLHDRRRGVVQTRQERGGRGLLPEAPALPPEPAGPSEGAEVRTRCGVQMEHSVAQDSDSAAVFFLL